MSYLQTLLATKLMGKQASIHDCHNTYDVAGNTEVIIGTGTSVLYTNDKVGYEFKNAAYNTWDSTNDLIDMSNVVLNSKVDILIGGEMKAGTANANLVVELIIPATVEIVVIDKTFVIPDVGAYHTDDINFHTYNSAAAKADNFQIRLSAVGGDITIKNKVLLTRIS